MTKVVERFQDGREYFAELRERVEYAGAVGVVRTRDRSRDALWVEFETGTMLFTRRAGDVFRAFPGPADGPALAIHFPTV